MNANTQHDNLRKLSDVGDLDVAEQDPDVRGWEVTVSDGSSIGEVDDLIIDTNAMKVRYLEVDLDTDVFNLSEDRHVLVPIASAQLDREEEIVYLQGLSSQHIAQLPAYTETLDSDYDSRFANTSPAADTVRSDAATGRRLTRAEEELRIGKRAVEAGEVVIGKHVETEHVSTPVTRKRERVKIERRPVSDSRDASALREDEIRVPVMEEELVIEKRAVVKEELVITKETIEEADTVEADVRRERFDIEPGQEELIVDSTQPDSRTRRGDR